MNIQEKLRDMWSKLFGTTVYVYRETSVREMTPEEAKAVARAFILIDEAFDTLDRAFHEKRKP